MRAILLAGGAGTRLRTVVSDVPKPMAPIAGRPFLSYLMDFLGQHGVTEIILSVGYLRQSIIDAYGDRYRDIGLSYSIEEEPLGTGGGLRQALAQVDRFPVFALNADTFLDLDYAAMLHAHEAAKTGLTIALRDIPDVGRYGQAILDGDRVVGFEANPAGGRGSINAGVYMFAGNILKDESAKAFSFERDFLERDARAIRPLAVVSDGYFIDIGVPEDFQRAQTELPQRLGKLAAASSTTRRALLDQ